MRSIALALLIVWIAAHSQEPAPRSGKDVQKPQTQTTNDKERSTAEQRGTKESPLIIEMLPALKSKEQAAHEDYEHHEKPTLDRWLSYATVALVGVTAALAVFTYFLWGATKKLISEAKETAERQLRAYVSVDAAGISGVASGQIPHAKVVIKNAGKTPAYQVTILGGIAMGESFDALPTPAIDPGNGYGKGVLASGGSFVHESDGPFPLSDAQVAKLQSGSLKLFAHGKISYFDVFKNKLPWSTPYRFMLRAIDSQGNGRLTVCKDGNDPE